ncbi:hypothetical protein MTO96_034833 [Rhipicephalus appendiculatus]
MNLSVSALKYNRRTKTSQSRLSLFPTSSGLSRSPSDSYPFVHFRKILDDDYGLLSLVLQDCAVFGPSLACFNDSGFWYVRKRGRRTTAQMDQSIGQQFQRDHSKCRRRS